MADLRFEDDWFVVEDEWNPEEETSRATVFAHANGYMGVRGAPEEMPASIPGVKGAYVNGIYDTPRGKLTEREIINIPDWTYMRILVDGKSLPDKPTRQTRRYGLQGAPLTRMAEWVLPDNTIMLHSQRLLPLRELHIGVIRWTVTSQKPCTLTIESGIDSNVNNRWADHFRSVRCEKTDDGIYTEITTFEPAHTVGVLAVTDCSPQAERRGVVSEEGLIFESLSFQCQSGGQLEVTKWAAVHDGRFTDGLLADACAHDLRHARESGWSKLHARHLETAKTLLDACDVEIEGDEAAQFGMRFSLWHLLMAAPRHDDRISMPARGLQGQDYYGSIFWDCETFVLPLFTYTVPQIARNALGYRTHTLDGARRKAESLGYEGAYYAWQSQETGDEQCDTHVFTHPATGEPIRSYFADEQIHISADIAIAAWQYYVATGDEQFWSDGGAEIVVEVARFYVSRVTYVQDRDKYELHSVLGPDEYHERVNNNAFTNYLAREALEIGGRVVRLLRERDPEALRRIMETLSLTDADVSQWAEVASRLYLPQPDPVTRLIPQFDGYFDLRDEPVEETRKKLVWPNTHRCGPLGPYQDTQNIKQADVVMLLYVLRDRFDAETKRANWEYYEPRTDHGSSLSPMGYSLVAADIGMIDWAYRYFIYTSHIDLESYGPHWNLGIHAASLGGAWLAVVHGFCHLRFELDGVHVTHWPVLPEKWHSLRVNLTWHGRPFTFVTDGRSLSIESHAARDLPLRLPDGEYTVAPEQTFHHSYQPS